ncbi:hypothetical protein L4C36_20710 [Photobacterium japonica]|uniref:hypothetical protein n=1 Tax=Photobacterium japonica TaxID=2910235 RepID=UPI003D0C568F
MKEKERFELAKPHNMVLMKWPKNITPVQIKAVHLVTLRLKQWLMSSDFKPDFSKDDPIAAFDGIKTSFDMSLDEFATSMRVSKKALKAHVKDADGNTVMMRGANKHLPKLRIQEHFSEIRKIECMVSNSSIITAEDGLILLPNPSYDPETDRVRLETTQTVAAILQDERFMNNRSFVDMRLQMTLNSVMASHILDRISRFKGSEQAFSCTVGDLIDQCGIDEGAINNRSNFIMVNLTRPLKLIAEKSEGVWELIGSGVKVTAKKRGKLLRSDVIKFTVIYNDPDALGVEELVSILVEGDLDYRIIKQLVDLYQFGVPHIEQGNITQEMLDVLEANIEKLFTPEQEMEALKFGVRVGKISMVIQFNEAGMGEAALLMKE